LKLHGQRPQGGGGGDQGKRLEVLTGAVAAIKVGPGGKDQKFGDSRQERKRQSGMARCGAVLARCRVFDNKTAKNTILPKVADSRRLEERGGTGFELAVIVSKTTIQRKREIQS